jgi:glycosyltransferase involved in cell wall biosynthesis
MRIIFTVTNDLTYDQRMQKICRSLSKAGYEIELVGRQRSFSIPLQEELFRQTRLTCWFNKGKLFYLEYNLRLLFYLAFSQFEAACAIDLDTIIPVCIIGKLKGAKVIYDAHEYFTEVPEVIGRPLIKRIWQWVEKTFVPEVDLAYTVSSGLAELFTTKYQKPFRVIMNVPPLEKADIKVQASPTGQAPTILYQGALNEGRGLEHLIEAMQHINAKLRLAGEGDLSSDLRALAKKYKVEDKVEFLGNVKPVSLKQITTRAYIAINLLENKGLSYYYSLSNKFFDYIQAGVPQICIDFPEYRRINDQYCIGLLAKDCAVKEIEAVINRLISDSDLYSQLKKNCEVCSKVFNWEEEERKLIALYHGLLR